MARHSHLDPAPFFLEAGPTGMLLLHGFTGAPTEVRLIGEYLYGQGVTVSGPLLPGHGTTVEDLNARAWTEWTSHARKALAELKDRCTTVFVGGLSMGSLLAVYLAAHEPQIAGAVLYSPALKLNEWRLYLTPLLKYLIPFVPKSVNADQDLTDPTAVQRLWSYDENPVRAGHQLLKLQREARRVLPQVTCPLLVICSSRDESIHPDSARYTYQRAGTAKAHKELITLHNCGHNLVVDSEWQTVADHTLRFVQQYAGSPEEITS